VSVAVLALTGGGTNGRIATRAAVPAKA